VRARRVDLILLVMGCKAACGACRQAALFFFFPQLWSDQRGQKARLFARGKKAGSFSIRVPRRGAFLAGRANLSGCGLSPTTVGALSNLRFSGGILLGNQWTLAPFPHKSPVPVIIARPLFRNRRARRTFPCPSAVPRGPIGGTPTWSAIPIGYLRLFRAKRVRKPLCLCPIPG